MNVEDQVIVAAYAEFDVPSDQIATDPLKAKHFAKLVNAKLPNGCLAFSPTEVAKRTVYLRKRGFLQRLRR